MRHVLSALLLLTPLFGQEARSDRPDLISRIKTEAFDNAQVMDTLRTSPTLTARDSQLDAAPLVLLRPRD